MRGKVANDFDRKKTKKTLSKFSGTCSLFVKKFLKARKAQHLYR